MFPGLSQNLNGHIIRNQVFLDQLSEECIFCFRSSRESHFYLFKSNLHQKFEKLHFLFQIHGDDKCLVAVTQVNTAPNGSFVHILFFCPLHTFYRRHEILSLVLTAIFHSLFLLTFLDTYI